MKLPRPRPCIDCPFRCDAPSGLWDRAEYEKLPGYDCPTHLQPTGVFLCHQDGEAMCAGWVGVIDAQESMALRIAAAQGEVTPEQWQQLLVYETDVPLHPDCTTAAEAGLYDLDHPGPEARQRALALLRAGRGHVTQREEES